MEKMKLPVHEHPLYHVGGNQIHGNMGLLLFCNGCYGEGHMDKGYRCSQCPLLYLHKKCGDSAPEINHPSHPEHPLKLLAGPQCSGKRCNLCGVILELLCYHCSICDFTLDTGCAIDPHPPLPTIEQPKAHEHTLTLISSTDNGFTCHVCGGFRVRSKYFYLCSLCDLSFHIECASLSPEINHSSHPRHVLRFIEEFRSTNTSDCWLCHGCIGYQSCYECSSCKFTVDQRCVRNPPPLAVTSPKTHKHELTLMPRFISFTCNACGMQGDRSPYVCTQCNFIIHGSCIDLPGLIYINRHDHPISHTYDLIGSSSQECRICRKTIDSYYGAYSCSKCKNYSVHSRCATQTNVWDGRDIEGEPEEIEDVAPFKVIGNNLIKHFSHEEHDMKLVINDGSRVHEEENISCKACVEPIGMESFYKCMLCDFFLHERCANLPLKKRHMLLPEKFFLVGGASYFQDTFCCGACGKYSSGFRYRNGPYQVDLQCISTSEPVKREAHEHPLYYFSEKKSESCCCCSAPGEFGFECLVDACWFKLHFLCAIFPERVKHKSDDHTLRLWYQEDETQSGFELPTSVISRTDGNGRHWCDICETEVNIHAQYYTCDDCGTTFHITCVLGDLFGSISPGSIITHKEVRYAGYMEYNYDECWEYKFEVVPNVGIVRPLCCVCHSRCTFSLVLKTHDDLDRYICSYFCLTTFHPNKNSPA